MSSIDRDERIAGMAFLEFKYDTNTDNIQVWGARTLDVCSKLLGYMCYGLRNISNRGLYWKCRDWVMDRGFEKEMPFRVYINRGKGGGGFLRDYRLIEREEFEETETTERTTV